MLWKKEVELSKQEMELLFQIQKDTIYHIQFQIQIQIEFKI